MIKKILISTVAVAVLAGCQQVKPSNVSLNTASGDPLPVEAGEKSLKVVHNCMTNQRRTFQTHKLTYTLQDADNFNCLTNGKRYSKSEQRNQYRTDLLSVKSARKVVFESDFSLTTDSTKAFTLLTMHPGNIKGCAPPISVNVTGYTVTVVGGVRNKKTGECKEGAVRWNETTTTTSGERAPQKYFKIKRDGTPQKIRIEIEHLANRNAKASVFVDNKLVIDAYYNRPDASIYDSASKYGYHFGLYSPERFEYTAKFDNVVFKSSR